jgi:hypothetical protein
MILATWDTDLLTSKLDGAEFFLRITQLLLQQNAHFYC